MNKRFATILAIASALGMAAFAADREAKVQDRLDASADTMTDMMKASDRGIPQDLLDKARCSVVIPGMKKAGFIIGAKYRQRIRQLPSRRRGLDGAGCHAC